MVARIECPLKKLITFMSYSFVSTKHNDVVLFMLD